MIDYTTQPLKVSLILNGSPRIKYFLIPCKTVSVKTINTKLFIIWITINYTTIRILPLYTSDYLISHILDYTINHLGHLPYTTVMFFIKYYILIVITCSSE